MGFVGGASCVLLSVGIAVAPGAPVAATTKASVVSDSLSPVPASDAWRGYVEGSGASTIRPVAATAIGDVTDPQGLLHGTGVATLTWTAGQVQPILDLDYGKEVGGLPFFDISAVTPGRSADSVSMLAGYSEAKQDLLGAPPSTTLAVAATAGQRVVKVTALSHFAPGDRLTIGTGSSSDTAVLSEMGTPAFRTTLAESVPSGATNVKVTSIASAAYAPVAFSPGDTITLGAGSRAERAVVESVGSAGKTGTGLTLKAPLGLGQSADAPVFDPGSGMTLSAPLRRSEGAGSAVRTRSIPVVGDRNGNNGVGTDPNRTDSFSLTSASDGTTVGNAETDVQGGERFEAITLTSPGTVTLSDVGIKAKFNNAGADAYQGYFLSSNPTLNKIWYAGVYTVQTASVPVGATCEPATTGSTPTCNQAPTVLDGAKRDRRPWIGDLSLEARTLFDSLGFGADGSAYIEGALGMFGSAPRANGSVCGQVSNWTAYPSAPVNCKFYSPAYSMYFPVSLAEYYLYTGDIGFVESQYEAMANELAYNATAIDPTTGLSIASGKDWDFYDGSKGGSPDDGGAVSATNMLNYEALLDGSWVAAQLMAADPSNASVATWSADAAAWSQQAAALKKAINSRLFNSRLGAYQLSSSNNGTVPATAIPEDANSEAIDFGVAPTTDVHGILADLKNKLWGAHGPQPYTANAGYSNVISPFAAGYELDARFASGNTAGALELTNRLWAQMVNTSGPFYTGTLWEKLNENGTDVNSNASLSHGWATAPVSAFSNYLLGVQPTSPGYETWAIAPQTGGLAWAQGRVPTPTGGIVSRWRAGLGTFKLTVSAPVGTRGTVSVPLMSRSGTIAENASIVWANGAAQNGADARQVGRHVVFSGVTGANTFLSVVEPPTITTTSLPNGVVGASYSAHMMASGGTGTYTWSRIAGTKPPGLSFSSSGAWSGKPTAAGTYTFTVEVEDSLGITRSKQLSVTITKSRQEHLSNRPKGWIEEHVKS